MCLPFGQILNPLACTVAFRADMLTAAPTGCTVSFTVSTAGTASQMLVISAAGRAFFLALAETGVTGIGSGPTARRALLNPRRTIDFHNGFPPGKVFRDTEIVIPGGDIVDREIFSRLDLPASVRAPFLLDVTVLILGLHRAFIDRAIVIDAYLYIVTVISERMVSSLTGIGVDYPAYFVLFHSLVVSEKCA